MDQCGTPGGVAIACLARHSSTVQRRLGRQRARGRENTDERQPAGLREIAVLRSGTASCCDRSRSWPEPSPARKHGDPRTRQASEHGAQSPLPCRLAQAWRSGVSPCVPHSLQTEAHSPGHAKVTARVSVEDATALARCIMQMSVRKRASHGVRGTRGCVDLGGRNLGRSHARRGNAHREGQAHKDPAAF